MKRKLNLRAFAANLIILLVLCPMVGSALAAHGVNNWLAYVLPFAVLTLLIMLPKRDSKAARLLKAEGLFLLAHLANGIGAKTAGIQREIWEAHILENLFPSDSFLEGLLDESEYVDYHTVHNPQAGSNQTVLVDPAFPLNSGNGMAVAQRTDTVNDWNIHIFFYPPIVITNAEEVELSYNKMSSVLYDAEMKLRKTIAENLIVYCAPTGTAALPAEQGGGTNNNILRSTGISNNDITNVQSAPAYTSGATGNRLKYTLYDIATAKLSQDILDIPDEDRFMLMSPQAERQIIDDMIATKYRASLGDVFDLKTGKITALMGYTMKKRSQVMQYNNANTPLVKAWGAAGAATDNDAILFWQKAALAKAIGDIHIYDQMNSPRDAGDIYSFLIRMGATKKRTSELGVGVIVQQVSV